MFAGLATARSSSVGSVDRPPDMFAARQLDHQARGSIERRAVAHDARADLEASLGYSVSAGGFKRPLPRA